MFVKKSTHEKLQRDMDELLEAYGKLQKHANATDSQLENAHSELTKLTDKLLKSREKISELESGIRKNEDQTKAILNISDDLETVTPISKVREETLNKLVEKQYLPYNKRHDDFAINLAVMLVAYEALEQIIFSFEEALNDSNEGGDYVD